MLCRLAASPHFPLAWRTHMINIWHIEPFFRTWSILVERFYDSSNPQVKRFKFSTSAHSTHYNSVRTYKNLFGTQFNIEALLTLSDRIVPDRRTSRIVSQRYTADIQKKNEMMQGQDKKKRAIYAARTDPRSSQGARSWHANGVLRAYCGSMVGYAIITEQQQQGTLHHARAL